MTQSKIRPSTYQPVNFDMKMLEYMTQAEQEQALAYFEALTKIEAKDHLRVFAGRNGYTPAKHHQLIIDHLEALERREIQNLLVVMPPGSAKSTFGSIQFPAWYLGRNPRHLVLAASNTMELAERFGRKVRGLVSAPDFGEVFSGVGLSEESAAAARWETTAGGEYFACLRRYATITTLSGQVSASEIKPGDVLANCGKPVRVLQVFNSEHAETFRIAGLDCSALHPVWTMNRGWVYTKNLDPFDVLCVESFIDKAKALIRRLYGYLEHPDVPTLVQPEVTLYKPKQRKVEKLRRARDWYLRALAHLRELHGGYGSPAVAGAYGWSDRQRRGLQSWKLPMGNAAAAGEQPPYERVARREDDGPACTGTRNNPGSYSLQDETRTRPTEQREEADAELRSYGHPEGIGWLRRASARFLVRCCKPVLESSKCTQVYLAGYRQAAADVLGFLLGVRRAGPVTVEHHGAGKHFVNFLTDGDHTFFAEGVLTHNCGVGSSIAGRRSDLLSIDDVVRSREDVDSEQQRDKVWNWYVTDVLTRLKPNAIKLFVNTRWHEDDLAGRILNRDGDKWTVLHMEMENTREDDPLGRAIGERLWPEWFTQEMVDEAKQDVGTWNALYQGRPSPDGGGEFKKDWVEYYDNPPDRKRVTTLMLVDPANTKNKRSDYTAIWVLGAGGDDNFYVLDMIRDRFDLSERVDKVFALHRKWRPVEVRYEQYGLQTDIDSLKKEMDMRSYRFKIRPVAGTHISKEDRIRRLIPYFKNGRIIFPHELIYTDHTGKTKDMVKYFIDEEYAPFPVAKKKDLHDALSRLAEPGLVLPKHVTEEEKKEMFMLAETEFVAHDPVMGY